MPSATEVALGIAAWCDRDGAVVDEKGVWPEVLARGIGCQARRRLFANTEYGSPQQDLSAIVDVAGQDGAIVVDVTASDATVPALQLAIRRGYGAVTANKIPLTGPQAVFNSLARAGNAGGRSPRFRYESTVGSAVPIIEATLGLDARGRRHRFGARRAQRDSRVSFHRVTAQAGKGAVFSELVHEAMEPRLHRAGPADRPRRAGRGAEGADPGAHPRVGPRVARG